MDARAYLTILTPFFCCSELQKTFFVVKLNSLVKQEQFSNQMKVQKDKFSKEPTNQ